MIVVWGGDHPKIPAPCLGWIAPDPNIVLVLDLVGGLLDSL
jgi:hypothetical protein